MNLHDNKGHWNINLTVLVSLTPGGASVHETFPTFLVISHSAKPLQLFDCTRNRIRNIQIITDPRNITAARLGYRQDRDQTKQAAIVLAFFLELVYHRNEWAGKSSQGHWQPLLASITTLQAAGTYASSCYKYTHFTSISYTSTSESDT